MLWNALASGGHDHKGTPLVLKLSWTLSALQAGDDPGVREASSHSQAIQSLETLKAARPDGYRGLVAPVWPDSVWRSSGV
jgi:hypothetical protein